MADLITTGLNRVAHQYPIRLTLNPRQSTQHTPPRDLYAQARRYENSSRRNGCGEKCGLGVWVVENQIAD
ncbi:MAG: hypothetical protein QF920_09355, partial [Verrucomicrobiota bacterium]|nr:hypothetical protein [Verrucomicrobiota bacterium]